MPLARETGTEPGADETGSAGNENCSGLQRPSPSPGQLYAMRAARSCSGSRREMTCETPSPPIVTP